MHVLRAPFPSHSNPIVAGFVIPVLDLLFQFWICLLRSGQERPWGLRWGAMNEGAINGGATDSESAAAVGWAAVGWAVTTTGCFGDAGVSR